MQLNLKKIKKINTLKILFLLFERGGGEEPYPNLYSGSPTPLKYPFFIAHSRDIFVANDIIDNERAITHLLSLVDANPKKGRATCGALPSLGFCQFSITLHFLIVGYITLASFYFLLACLNEYNFYSTMKIHFIFILLENFSLRRNLNKFKIISRKQLITSENQS